MVNLLRTIGRDLSMSTRTKVADEHIRNLIQWVKLLILVMFGFGVLALTMLGVALWIYPQYTVLLITEAMLFIGGMFFFMLMLMRTLKWLTETVGIK